MITGHQLRDARRLIGWTVLALARVSKVPRATLSRAEAAYEAATLSDSDARALMRTFEAAGIEFTAEDPPGARLKAKPDVWA